MQAALVRYEEFHGMSPGAATAAMLETSSAGIRGWAMVKANEAPKDRTDGRRARADQDPVRPGLVAFWIAQSRQLPPDRDHGLLDRILRRVDVARPGGAGEAEQGEFGQRVGLAGGGGRLEGGDGLVGPAGRDEDLR